MSYGFRSFLLGLVITAVIGALLFWMFRGIERSLLPKCAAEAAKLGAQGRIVYRECWAVLPNGRVVRIER